MSGPKSYSVEVFDKHLKMVFLLQSEIQILWDSLSFRNNNQNNLAIKDVIDDFFKRFRENLPEENALLKAQFDKPLNQKQFDKFYNQIHDFINQQNEIKKTLEAEIAHLDEMEEKYNLYLELKALKQNYAADFAELKKQLMHYFENLNPKNDSRTDQINEINQLTFDYKLADFDPEKSENIRQEKIKLIEAFEDSRRKLTTISQQNSSNEKVTETSPKVQLAKGDNVFNYTGETIDKLALTVKAIHFELNQITDKTLFGAYRERLQNISHPNKNQELYFAVELLEDIRQGMNQQDLRAKIAGILNKLANTHFDESLKKNTADIESRARRELQRVVLKQNDFAQISEAVNKLLEQNRSIEKKKMIARQEQQFIKARLVSVLQDLNYEVVSKTEVMDLEKSDSFLLQIPDQNNFLNIRFDAEGKMLYNFLIPEDRDELSYDQKSLKLSEMEETCNKFGKMLTELQKKGLNVELQKEIEISEKALIRLPEKYRDKVRTGKAPKKTDHSTKNKNLYL